MLVNIRFQVLFHSPPGVLFTFPSQYFSTIGHQVVFRLGGWSPHLLTGFHVPADTLDPVSLLSISPTSLSLSPDRFPKTIRLSSAVPCTVHTPKVLLLPVWPLPLSLATTRGISVDFSSSRYLDVSVPGVPLMHLLIQCMIHGSSPCVFPHSEICGSKLICSSPQLIAACHVLLRLLMPRHSPYALLSFNFFLLLQVFFHSLLPVSVL